MVCQDSEKNTLCAISGFVILTNNNTSVFYDEDDVPFTAKYIDYLGGGRRLFHADGNPFGITKFWVVEFK